MYLVMVHLYIMTSFLLITAISLSKASIMFINSSKNMKELLGAPFLLKMFVEALPLVKDDKNIGILDIYENFEEHSFDRELRK